MSRFSVFSLRSRLIFLVLLAVLPALALSIHRGLEQRRHALRDAQTQALTLVKHASNLQDNLIEEARALLFTMAEIPSVQQRDPAVWTPILANLLRTKPQYSALAAFRPDGEAFAGAPPLTGKLIVSDRAWYQRLLETRDFVVSEYLLGRSTGKAVIIFAQPVFDREQRLTAIVMASLDLGWLNRFIARSNMPPGANLTAVDRNGTILASYPGPVKLLGQAMPEAPIIKAMLSQEEGVLAAPGLEGVRRVFAFTSLGPKSGGVHIAVGLPENEVLAEEHRNLLINLTGLGLVALLALAAAWFGGDVFILRQVTGLLGVARRLGEGDLEARTGPPYRRGELGELAQAFDRMAESLEERERARREAEANLARQAQDLARSNAELEQFAYVASHDLQEPLRIIASYLQLLERRYRGELDAEADKFIDRAVGGTARMKRLINDLLLFSRVGSRGKAFELIDCAAVCREALENLKITVEETGAVVTIDGLPTVRGDGGELTQLFQNLISNGVKFHGEETPRVQVSAERQGNDWVFAVRDNGIGIEAEYLDRIFGVFQRLHSRAEYPGTGIGLALSKRIVERHGGRIWVESTPQQGSTFYFTIPNRGDIQK